MTRNEALARCRLLWVNYNKDSNWRAKDGIARDILPHLEFHCGCPACEFDELQSAYYCHNNCIVKWSASDSGGCCAFDSPYELRDGEGVLKCIDNSIAAYDAKRGNR